MQNILSKTSLRKALSATYSREVFNLSKMLRKANIDTFLSIDRKELKYAKLEHRMHLYSTLEQEKIYIQFPGKESAESNNTPMPKDFRPKLRYSDGSMMHDATFGFIWDILDDIGKRHRDCLGFMAAIFFRMGYMYDYLKTHNPCTCEILHIDDSNNPTMFDMKTMQFDWHQLYLPDNVWFSLNDRVGRISVTDDKSISFEAFMKFIDLLLQNEDCKYFYKNIIMRDDPNYNLRTGRTTTCDANLLILFYLKGNYKISALLNDFQKSRGVPTINKRDYTNVTDGIVISE